MGRYTKHNNITNDALLAKVNPDNQSLKRDFLAYLHSIGRSEGTILSYANDLDIFFIWNLQNNGDKHFTAVSKRDFIAFQNWLISENGNSPARVRRLRATISSLSNYIENILDDEFAGYRSAIKKVAAPPNAPTREKTVLTEDQLERLLSELVAAERYQIACAVALAAFSGARKSELTRFKVSCKTSRRTQTDGK